MSITPETNYNYVLQVIRHEFAHSILNESISKYSYLIEDSLKKVSDYLNLNIVISTEELIAQNIENIHYANSEKFIQESSSKE